MFELGLGSQARVGAVCLGVLRDARPPQPSLAPWLIALAVVLSACEGPRPEASDGGVTASLVDGLEASVLLDDAALRAAAAPLSASELRVVVETGSESMRERAMALLCGKLVGTPEESRELTGYWQEHPDSALFVHRMAEDSDVDGILLPALQKPESPLFGSALQALLDISSVGSETLHALVNLGLREGLAPEYRAAALTVIARIEAGPSLGPERGRLQAAVTGLQGTAREAADGALSALAGKVIVNWYSGRVVHQASGKPIPDAFVFIAYPWERAVPYRRAVRTDADGRYRIEVRGTTPVACCVMAKGIGADNDVYTRPAPNYTSVTLPTAERVRGIVIDVEGQPVAGAVVRMIGVSSLVLGGPDGSRDVWPVNPWRIPVGIDACDEVLSGNTGAFEIGGVTHVRRAFISAAKAGYVGGGTLEVRVGKVPAEVRVRVGKK